MKPFYVKYTSDQSLSKNCQHAQFIGLFRCAAPFSLKYSKYSYKNGLHIRKNLAVGHFSSFQIDPEKRFFIRGILPADNPFNSCSESDHSP